MKVVIVEPGKPARIAEVEHSLESFQKIVGGYIECYEPFEDECVIVCNEEGKLTHEPVMNRAIATPDGKLRDVICGTFFICSAPAESEDFQSLTDEQADKYAEMFKKPHTFIRDKNGGIAVNLGI